MPEDCETTEKNFYKEPILQNTPSTSHQETLSRIPIAIRQCHLIITKHPDAQPVHEFAAGLYQLILDFEQFYHRFKPAGYIYLSGNVCSHEYYISSRVTSVFNRLMDCRQAARMMHQVTKVNGIWILGNGVLVDELAVRELRCLVMPRLVRLRKDAQVISFLFDKLASGKKLKLKRKPKEKEVIQDVKF